MMYPIMSTAGLVLANMLACIFTKQKPNYKIISIAAFVYFVVSSFMAHGDEFKPRYSCKVNECTYENTAENFQCYEDLVWGHLCDAEECMLEAKEISVLLPFQDQERAEMYFKVVMSGFTPGTPLTKVLAMGITFLTEYIPASSKEWSRVVYLVEKAHYHMEMAIFYNVLSKQIFGESQF